MALEPLLVLAWGNRSRGDDALGPLFIDALRDAMPAALAERVALLEEHQLNPELAFDLIGRERVLMADADPGAPVPHRLIDVRPARDASLSSHALSPAALLAVCQTLTDKPCPPVTLMGLHGSRFGLGLPLSDPARAALPASVQWALRWLSGTAG